MPIPRLRIRTLTFAEALLLVDLAGLSSAQRWARPRSYGNPLYERVLRRFILVPDAVLGFGAGSNARFR